MEKICGYTTESLHRNECNEKKTNISKSIKISHLLQNHFFKPIDSFICYRNMRNAWSNFFGHFSSGIIPKNHQDLMKNRKCPYNAKFTLSKIFN